MKQDSPEILDKVNFVYKINFGKLNYNVRVSNYQDNKEFYKEHVNIVIDFCAKHGIEHHIKYGTQKKDDRKTEGLFRKDSDISSVNKINVCNLESVELNI